MNLYLHPVCALIAWLALAYKISALRRSPRDYALIALCSVLACSALSFTLSHPAVWVYVDRIVGFSNGAALVSHSCVVLVVVSQQIVLAFWSHGEERAWRAARLRLLTAIFVLAVLVTLFMWMDPQEQRPTDFTLHYADHPLYATYLLFYLAFYATGEIDVARLSHRYATIAPRLWLRQGLRLVAVGASLTLGYSAIRAADIITALWFSADLHAFEPIAWTCGDIGALLTLIGWTLPGWGPYLHRWIHAYRQYRRLLPLWKALRAVPTIDLPTLELAPPARGIRHWRHASTWELKVLRKVVEIRDGQLALRSYVDPQIAKTAERLGRSVGLADDELKTAIEAAQLASALHARERTLSTGLPPPPPPADGPDPADLDTETTWLVQVAHAFTRSPVVAAALAAHHPTRTADNAKH